MQIISGSGSTFGIGKNLALGKIAPAYSQHVKKLEVPFVFEGVEVPATNMGRQLAQLIQFHYPVGEWNDLKSWEEI